MWVYMFHMIITKKNQSFDEWRWNGQKSETIRGSHRNLAWYRRSFPSIDSQLEMFLTTTVYIRWYCCNDWNIKEIFDEPYLHQSEWCYDVMMMSIFTFTASVRFWTRVTILIWKSDVNNSAPIGHWHFTCCSPVWRLSQWCSKHCKPMGQRPLLKLERWDWLAGCLNESWPRNNNCKVQEMESQKVAGADW